MIARFPFCLLTYLMFAVVLPTTATAQQPLSFGVHRTQCVPFETLPCELRSKANQLLTQLLDSEALFTVIGGLKPASDGFWQMQFPADQTTTVEIEETRAILSRVVCGSDLVAGVFVFERVFQGNRIASAFVAHRPRLREEIQRHQVLFDKLGITADTCPQQVFERIDRGPTALRWRAFGLIFGYPEYAIDFFVDAGEKQQETGKFVERDFRSIPTFAGDRKFVYAVPKGHLYREEDRQLRERASPILDEYRCRREHYIGPNKPGAAYLLRDWFDNGQGFCFVPDGNQRVSYRPYRPAVIPYACNPTFVVRELPNGRVLCRGSRLGQRFR